MEIAPLDCKIIEDLRALGGDDEPEFFQSVVEQFFEDAPVHIQTIHRAVKESDQKTLTIAAQTLKGSARNLGAMPLSEICLLLEKCGRETQLMEASSLLTKLDAELSRVCEALREESQNPSFPRS